MKTFKNYLKYITKNLIFYVLLSLQKCKIHTNYHQIVILDDIFPHKLSAFRYAEFTNMLSYFKELNIYSNGNSLSHINEKNSYKQMLNEFINCNIEYKERVHEFKYYKPITADIAYIVFLNNVLYYFKYLEKCKIPFIFTLYPGGGLTLNNKECDEKLNMIFSSKLFRSVIVTQKNVYEYLIDKNLCDISRINFIYGVVLPHELLSNNKISIRKTFHEFNICFVAYKYMNKGLDKGYDIFIDTCKILVKHIANLKIHIVGNWTAYDYEINGLNQNIFFHGTQRTDFFKEFYSNMDIILSPNRHNMLELGAFDGFPTAAVTESSLCGVAMVVTDPLKLNLHYNENKDIIICEPDITEIAQKILHLYKNPLELQKLKVNGMKKSKNIYSIENQIKPRLEVIQKHIKLQK